MTEPNPSIALVPVQSASLVRKSAEALAIRGLSELQSRENANFWFQRAVDLLFNPPEELLSSEDPDEEIRRERQLCLLKAVEYDPCHVEALHNLGSDFQEQGDLTEAVAHYQRAAELGSLEAKCSLAYLFMNGSGKPELPPQEGDETCLSYFCGYAEQGNACAQYMYGKCFHYGLASAPKKVTQAAYWYAKAAEQGYAPAQLELGALFESGRGVAQDNVQASNWYCLAAKQGEAEAQYRLGSQFYKGLGVPEDIRQAEYWFSLASIKGFKNASVMLEICKAGVSHAVMERMSKENAGNHG